MIDKGFFDLIYHEHLSYFSLNPIKYLFEKYDLRLFNYQKVEIGASGPALRVFLCKKNFKKKVTKKLKKQLKRELDWGLSNILKYKNFSKKLLELLKI